MEIILPFDIREICYGCVILTYTRRILAYRVSGRPKTLIWRAVAGILRYLYRKVRVRVQVGGTRLMIINIFCFLFKITVDPTTPAIFDFRDIITIIRRFV